MPIDPFKSTAYQVGQIIRALTSDNTGNLIFRDELNPDGVTLSELINTLISSKINYNTDGTFFDGANTVQTALNYLNQFAYLKYTARFIYVDPTISDSLISEGEIYNTISDAVTYANTLIYNGYNNVSILLMGSHKESSLDNSSDNGIFTFSNTDSSIEIKNNGIRFYGLNKPTIRMDSCIGTSSNRKEMFIIDKNVINDSVSILFDNIDFEFKDSVYSTFFKIKNAPIDDKNRAIKGFKISDISVSFINGENTANRLFDISNSATKYNSNIVIDKLKIGGFYNITSAAIADELEFIYIDHNKDTRVLVNDIDMTQLLQPFKRFDEISDLTDITQTSFTAIKVNSGTVIVSEPKLDEKSYWNEFVNVNVKTRFMKIFGANSNVSIFNPSIVRNKLNPIFELFDSHTLITDWIDISSNSMLNVQGGADEIWDLDDSYILTGDVRPAKSYWNKDNFSFGIGLYNELRLGDVTSVEVSGFQTYNDTYGNPFWYNKDIDKLQYFDQSNVQTLAIESSLVNVSTESISASDWSYTSYNIGGGPTIYGYEYNFTHNLGLTNKYSFTHTLFDTTNNALIIPQQIRPINNNSIKIIVALPFNAQITVSG